MIVRECEPFFSPKGCDEKAWEQLSAGVHLGKAKGNWIWNWVQETRSGVQCGFWVFCRKANKQWLLETCLRSDGRWQLWLGGVIDGPCGVWAWAPSENTEVCVQHVPGIADLSDVVWAPPELQGVAEVSQTYVTEKSDIWNYHFWW